MQNIHYTCLSKLQIAYQATFFFLTVDERKIISSNSSKKKIPVRLEKLLPRAIVIVLHGECPGGGRGFEAPHGRGVPPSPSRPPSPHGVEARRAATEDTAHLAPLLAVEKIFYQRKSKLSNTQI